MNAYGYYNEVSVADRVVKACAWTDNSADFVFGDGTVLSFCDEMQTFVAIDGASWSRRSKGVEKTGGDYEPAGDYYFTALALSKHEKKVKEAVQIYNYYSSRPRVISGLTVTPCEVWRHPGPIDSLVVAADRRLFERHGQYATLWCALRRISLTLHGGRVTFSVRWPAPAVERNGARSIFVRPHDSGGFMRGTLNSMHTVHFVWMEQTFPLSEPPSEWVRMLQIALHFDAELPADYSPSDTTGDRCEEDECQVFYETTPPTANDKKPCRFSTIRREHAHAFIATTQMQSATCNRYLRSSRERVLWRYDADPMGRVPHAIYWSLNVRCSDEKRYDVRSLAACSTAGGNLIGSDDESHSVNAPTVNVASTQRFTSGSVLAMVREDESVVVVEPMGNSYVVHHWRRDGVHNVYHQSPDGALGLPHVIPQEQVEKDGDGHHGCMQFVQNETPLHISGAEHSDGVVNSQLGRSMLYFSGVLEEAPFASMQRGRYLPDVGGSCIEISQLNLASLRAGKQEDLFGEIARINLRDHKGGEIKEGAEKVSSGLHVEATADAALSSGVGAAIAPADRVKMYEISNDPALEEAVKAGSVVYFTSAIEGVGTFAALTNGTVRCHFDDRTILHLIPGVDDREENMVVTCLFRDATRCCMRLTKGLSDSATSWYISYAMHFRRFIRLAPEARAALINEKINARELLEEVSPWRQEEEVQVRLQRILDETQQVLMRSSELSRVNKSLLHDVS
uniref:C5orf34-like C-terminal domain-containing protein n=1 Tax=Trypanosoma congolense (strain IL3000) TaxID=1068625 RepID=G0UJC3_TRYCI|nr:conserved hypothetical protein [Trypanosoma congolense IL3000]